MLFGIFGALTAVWIRREFGGAFANDVYSQLGMLALLGSLQKTQF